MRVTVTPVQAVNDWGFAMPLSGLALHVQSPRERYNFDMSLLDLKTVLGDLGWKRLTLAASFGALAVSTRTYFQKKGEGEFSQRKAFIEVLEKLTAQNTEIAKFRALSDRSTFPSNYIGLIDEQGRFLAEQASQLASKIRHMVTPMEYLVIAEAYKRVGSAQKAEEYFKRAMQADAVDMGAGMAHRQYGRFLFEEDRVDDGRRYFVLASETVKGDSDRELQFRSETFVRLAVAEAEYGDPANVNASFTCGLELCERIRSSDRHASAFEHLAKHVDLVLARKPDIPVSQHFQLMRRESK